MDRDIILDFLKNFKEKNSKKYHIKKIGIFGSIARNDYHPESDIDIVVELDKQDFFLLIGIKQDIEEQFHKHVDIVSYRNRMNSFLKERIRKEAIYV